MEMIANFDSIERQVKLMAGTPQVFALLNVLNVQKYTSSSLLMFSIFQFISFAVPKHGFAYLVFRLNAIVFLCIATAFAMVIYALYTACIKRNEFLDATKDDGTYIVMEY